jgi:hypothetical protein
MDYPPPLVVRDTAGVTAVLKISLDSYLTEIGAFDLVSLYAAYGDVPSGGGGGGADTYIAFEEQRRSLGDFIAARSAPTSSSSVGYLFLSDSDAAAGLDARGSKWDLAMSPDDDGGGGGGGGSDDVPSDSTVAHPLVMALLLSADVRALALEQVHPP